MTTTWGNDIVHQFIFTEASGRWRKSRRSLLGLKILSLLFRGPIPDALYVQEYSDADWVTGEIRESLVGTWIVDNEGFRATDAPAIDEVSHRRFERLIFCSGKECVSMTHYYSPFGGFGQVLCIQTRNGKQTLRTTKSWIF